jgi:hypothetical protein
VTNDKMASFAATMTPAYVEKFAIMLVAGEGATAWPDDCPEERREVMRKFVWAASQEMQKVGVVKE